MEPGMPRKAFKDGTLNPRQVPVVGWGRGAGEPQVRRVNVRPTK